MKAHQYPFQPRISPRGSTFSGTREALTACAVALILVLVACGLPNQQIALAYVVGDKVPVHVEPKRGSPVMAAFKRDTKLVIVKERIPDRELGVQTYWYGIKTADGKDAYLSYDEQLVRRNITTVQPLKEPTWGLVLASSLHVRSAPSITAPVIGSKARNAIVSVSGRGGVYQQIGDSYGRWLEISSGQGHGYVFSGYIETGTKGALEKLARGDYRRLKGWVQLKEDAVVYEALGPERKPARIRDDCSRKDLRAPRKNDYASVTVSLKHDNVLYYKIAESGASNDGSCNSFLEGWIAAVSVEFVPDFFTHTLKKSNNALNPDLLREFNRAVGGNLNVGSVRLKTVEIARARVGEKPETAEAKTTAVASGKPIAEGGRATDSALSACATLYLDPKAQEEAEGKGTEGKPARCQRYLQLQGKIAHNGQQKVAFMLRDGGAFATVGVFDAEDITAADVVAANGSILRDFDGDGNMEIVTSVSNRGESSKTVFALANNRYREVFRHSEGGPWRIAMAGRFLLFKAHDGADRKYLTLTRPFSDRYSGRRERALRFGEGRFVEVDSKHSGVDFKKAFSL